MFARALALLTLVSLACAHVGAWHKAMYCLNGLSNEEDLGSHEVSEPQFNLSYDEFWLRGKCKDFPPADGEYLDLPVGGKAMLELSSNRALTTLSYDGKFANKFPSREDHPDYDAAGAWDNTCIKEPNIHTENRTMATGSILAIAYKSDIHDVRPEDTVVISVLPNSPWHREAEFDIPAGLPACPEGGCTCIWAWIPGGCGQANMEHNAFRCRVTGSGPNARKLAKPTAAKYCEGRPDACVKGAKIMSIYHQQEGLNNVDVIDLKAKSGLWAIPTYNQITGFYPGAQNDIFELTAAPQTPAQVPLPKKTCKLKKRGLSRHRKQRRRILSFGGFSLYSNA